MLGILKGCDKDRFCRLLASLGDAMLKGTVPGDICPVLYGATLRASRKEDGGIRPIAAGLTLRTVPYAQGALDLWTQKYAPEFPPEGLWRIQRILDKPAVTTLFAELQAQSANEPSSIARLKAVCTNESGLWLRALPVAALGTLLDGSTLHLAVGQRIGVPVCASHTCVCGAHADSLGHHALSCTKSAGRHHDTRHDNLNGIIVDGFRSGDMETERKPEGPSDIDGRRPDGLTLPPWKSGKCLLG